MEAGGLCAHDTTYTLFVMLENRCVAYETIANIYKIDTESCYCKNTSLYIKYIFETYFRMKNIRIKHPLLYCELSSLHVLYDCHIFL